MWIRASLKDHLRSWVSDPMQVRRPRVRMSCPICGYAGTFLSFGDPPRARAMCPGCRSLERHRLLHLFLARPGAPSLDDKAILHIAPESHLSMRLRRNPRYVTGDVSAAGVDRVVDVCAMPFADGEFDVVIANHVLEHVADDGRALREIHRVLGPTGWAILMVPIVEARDTTHEDPALEDPAQRRLYFGQEDHVRLYGRDYLTRLAAAGFRVETFTATPRQAVEHGLVPGEKVFAAHRAAA
jgi:SAM-dependent methyltransferase